MTSPWKDRSVLVTGAGGFIGSSIAWRLLDEGADVTCLVRSRAPDCCPYGTTVYEGNVTDFDLLREIISHREVEYVFHLAANAIVRVGARDPMTTYASNIMGTVALLEAVRTVGRCRKVVVASSDKAYGDHEQLPYVESMPLQPRNTYDTSKACADMVARSYAHNYDMPVVVTRCSNVYGPGDRNFSRLVPNTIRRVLRGQQPELYSDISGMEREFVFIDDVVRAFLMLGLTGKETDGMAFNIGGTGARSIESFVQMILQVMNSELKPKIVPREPVFKEIQRQHIDADLLRRFTGWEHTTTDVEGIQKAVEWYNEALG